MKKIILFLSLILVCSFASACVSNDSTAEGSVVSVTLNLDGGTIEGDTSLSVLLWEDAYIPVPTKKGYKFSGWTHNGNFVSLKPWMIDENSVTIKANWEIRTYQVYFDYNGGLLYEKGKETTKKALSVTYGDKVEFEQPKKDGYDLIGWYYGEQEVNLNSFDVDVGKVIVKAKWKEKKQSVTFKFNGGREPNNSLDNERVIELQHNAEIPFPKLEKRGYTFGGWAYSDGTPFNSSTWLYNETASEIMAVWNPITVAYDFDLKGGTLDELGDKILYGGATSNLRNLVPQKQGYTFNCWMVNGNQLGFTFNYLPIDGNNKVILTADYVSNSYRLTLDPGEGSFENEDSKIVSVDYGVKTAINIPTAPLGKYFAGYKIEGTEELVCTSSGNVTWFKLLDAKLIAVYSSSKSVSFVHYDGSVNLISLDEVPYLSEEDIPIAKNPTGYNSYWELDYRQITSLNEPTEIYTVLSPHTYVVTYKDGNKVIDRCVYTYRESENLLTGSDVYNDGYELLGWSLSPEDKDKYMYGTVVWNILGNVELYAVWSNLSYTITYDTSAILTDFNLVDEFGNETSAVQNVGVNKKYKLYTLKAKNGSIKVTWQYDEKDFPTSGTFTQGKNIVLTPKITYNPIKINVNLDLNGGSGSTVASITLNSKFNTMKTNITPPKNMSVVAYSYKGQIYFINDTFNFINYDGTPIKVIYDTFIYFKINIDVNGGTGDNVAIIEYGKALGSMDGRPVAPHGKKLVGFVYDGVEYSISYVWDFNSYDGGVFKAIYISDDEDWSPIV